VKLIWTNSWEAIDLTKTKAKMEKEALFQELKTALIADDEFIAAIASVMPARENPVPVPVPQITLWGHCGECGTPILAEDLEACSDCGTEIEWVENRY